MKDSKYTDFFRRDTFNKLFLVISFIVLLAACSTEKEPEVSFKSDIVPIIKSKCMKCHIDGRVAPFLDSGHYYNVFLQKGYVIPSMADNSIAYIKVRDRHSITHTLTPEETEFFKMWINQGAEDN